MQAGVVLASLNRFLATKGLMFGPDPAMSHVTTMGSVVALDAGGSHWRKYGSARRHVEALKIVLADGDVLKVGRHPVPRRRPERRRKLSRRRGWTTSCSRWRRSLRGTRS